MHCIEPGRFLMELKMENSYSHNSFVIVGAPENLFDLFPSSVVPEPEGGDEGRMKVSSTDTKFLQTSRSPLPRSLKGGGGGEIRGFLVSISRKC